MLNIIKASLQNTEIKIKVALEMSGPVKVITGIRQGDTLSPLLFNLVSEKVIREMD